MTFEDYTGDTVAGPRQSSYVNGSFKCLFLDPSSCFRSRSCLATLGDVIVLVLVFYIKPINSHE